MAHTHPTQEQLQQLAEGPDGPVVMVNLLRYVRDEAGKIVGEASYMEYGAAVAPLLEGVGGRMIWAGNCSQVVIGDGRDDWDSVILVEYPSRAAFLQMAMSEEYAAIHHLRENAIETTAIVACDQLPMA